MEKFEVFLKKARPETEFITHEAHPPKELLFAFVCGELDVRKASRISAHLVTCRPCLEAVESMRVEIEELKRKLSQHLSCPKDSERKGLLGQITASWKSLSRQKRAFVLCTLGYIALAVAILFVSLKASSIIEEPFENIVRQSKELDIDLNTADLEKMVGLLRVKLVRPWWGKLYWILFPTGLALLGWGVALFFARRRGGDAQRRGSK